jgi:hypothetical protein
MTFQADKMGFLVLIRKQYNQQLAIPTKRWGSRMTHWVVAGG